MRSTKQEIRQHTDTELRLSSGSTFRLEVSGDVSVDGESDGTGDQQHSVTYHELVGRCCRQFTLIPKSSADVIQVTPKVCSNVLLYLKNHAKLNNNTK